MKTCLALLALTGAAGLRQDPAEDLPPGGIAVRIGWREEGDPAWALADTGRWLVHILVADEDRADSVRRALAGRGRSGAVTAEAWGGGRLPFPDHLVNAVLADAPGPAPEEEMLRILVPGGTLRIGERRVRKPFPPRHGSWTHARHGADGNMVSEDASVAAPTGLRWVAGPAQDAGGRKWYYDHVFLAAGGRAFYVYEESLVARDAYNGLLLWTRPLKIHTFKERGTTTPSEKNPRNLVGSRTTKVRPVVAGDTLFAAADGKLLALDAATGRDAAVLDVLKNPRELLVENGTLVVAEEGALRAWDVAARKLLWSAPLSARRIVAGGGAVYALSGTEAAAFDLATGRERWRIHDSDVQQVLTATYGEKLLVLEKATLRDDPIGCGLIVLSAEDGRTLWKKDLAPRMTHYQETRAFFAQGLLWVNAVEARGPQLVGLDPRTGEKRRHLWGAGGAHCAPPVATQKYFIAPECNFTDFETGERALARMVKGACRIPFVPANGLLYTFPVQCECYPMLRGYMALAADPPPKAESAPLLRPAPRKPSAVPAAPPAADEWPAYRRDAFRSGSTAARIRTEGLARKWEVPLVSPSAGERARDWKDNPFVRGPLTPPVAAGGIVVVAAPDLHRVIALEAETGRLRWSFAAGGRVDTPPTLDRGRCLFGAHDGWVYALDAADGSLLWKTRLAPADTKIPAYGQLESLWPVPGSVLVLGDLAYAAAGRHPLSDGGVHVAALRVETGEIVWRRALTEVPLTKWYGPKLSTDPKVKVGLDFEPVDLLVRDGDKVAMSRWRFDPATGEGGLELENLHYTAPGGRKIPRGLWGYGIRQTKHVLPKPPAVFDEREIYTGAKGDVALLLAGGVRLAATSEGDLLVGERAVPLEAVAVPDGLIAAWGRVYLSTQKGSLICLE
ncbi:MAG TPA: PQQ-binding-like beta-propeller repeat protein [Planctomycetota bacterium]|nr:PQQ-binding-like beta-propeller repeat protein [Planctomycetota bacterium]